MVAARLEKKKGDSEGARSHECESRFLNSAGEVVSQHADSLCDPAHLLESPAAVVCVNMAFI